MSDFDTNYKKADQAIKDGSGFQTLYQNKNKPKAKRDLKDLLNKNKKLFDSLGVLKQQYENNENTKDISDDEKDKRIKKLDSLLQKYRDLKAYEKNPSEGIVKLQDVELLQGRDLNEQANELTGETSHTQGKSTAQMLQVLAAQSRAIDQKVENELLDDVKKLLLEAQNQSVMIKESLILTKKLNEAADKTE